MPPSPCTVAVRRPVFIPRIPYSWLSFSSLETNRQTSETPSGLNGSGKVVLRVCYKGIVIHLLVRLSLTDPGISSEVVIEGQPWLLRGCEGDPLKGCDAPTTTADALLHLDKPPTAVGFDDGRL